MTDLNQFETLTTATEGGGSKHSTKNKSFRKKLFDYSGLVPFFIFSAAFIAAPSLTVIVLAFRDLEGNWTLENLRVALEDIYLLSLIGSIQLGLASASLGAVLGLIAAYAVAVSGKKKLQRIVNTASGVFANTGGVPLAFLFVAAIGNYGLVTIFLQNFGIDIYAGDFTLFGFSGLVVVYLYFQIPLMVIVTYPAIQGMRNEWREAAVNLGASKFSYWTNIGIPVLFPAAFGAFFLLFANAFAAYATASVLTAGTLPLIPLQIGSIVTGNVVADNGNVAMAMGLEMIVVVAIAMTIYTLLDRRASRWRKSNG
jgi:putative spermidine/putrescine transport system permease protein